jgi:iron complex outermembrane receptor protein
VFKYVYVALASAAMSLVVPAAADAQQAPITSGGNVTAEEVTPLPPVVVESPTQPLSEKKSKDKIASPVGGTPAQQATALAQQSG